MQTILRGENLKKGKIFIMGIITMLLATCTLTGEKTASAKAVSSYIVIEQSTCKVMKGANIHVRLPMASTTKIMTAYTVIKNEKNLDRRVKIPKEAVGIEGSSIYLKEGEELTVRELLYGLMMRSGNDSAVALAIATGGSVEQFVKQMNYESKVLGLKNTNFTNPHGLHDDNHYTTAYDLAVITAEAYNYKDFCDIVSCKNKTIGGENSEKRYLVNKNKILSMYEGANGVKTGYTKRAGRCLVTGAEKNGVQMIAVTLNIPDTYGQCIYLMDYGFRHWELVKNEKTE